MKLTPIENWVMESTGIKERSRNSLEEYQLMKLRETITYAKKPGRFYGEYLKNTKEKEILTLRDFQELPFTFPDQIKENSLRFLTVPQTEVKRIVTLNTTGTSGDSKRIFFSEEDMKQNLAFFKVGMSCLVEERDKVLVLLPGQAYGTIGDFLRNALRALNIPCFVEGILKNVDDTEKLIKEEGITCIVGIPFQIQYLSRMKAATFKKHITKVLLSTDFVPEVLKRELAEDYGCSVFNHYGMTEMGYGAAVECEALNGYHLRETDLYFEIINPETGAVVPDGEIGEVVFSTLNRTAMPLIRYRTGDLASFKKEKCGCGTFLKTMNRVLGRKDNKIQITEDVFLHLRELDELILIYKEVLDYKVAMTEENLLRIEVLLKENESPDKMKLTIEKSIIEYLYNKTNRKLKVFVTEKIGNKPDDITNSMVKRKIMDYRNSSLWRAE